MWLWAPSGAQHRVWEVVALTAVEAMEVGRQFMHARMRELRGSAAIPQGSPWHRRRRSCWAVACMWAHLQLRLLRWDGTRSAQPIPSLLPVRHVAIVMCRG